jgi:hypothetical protein
MRQSPCKWIERDAEGRPRCEHGWATSGGGGRWHCRKKQREAQLRYAPSEAAEEKKRESQRRYASTEKGRERTRKSNLRYASTEKGREMRREATRRFFETEKGYECVNAYRLSGRRFLAGCAYKAGMTLAEYLASPGYNQELPPLKPL